ncbi:MAG: DEAD/DEAH box helicase [Tannerella sp.]|jgi:SNF2 family DNA or RNA helicase|nr:DEAD/DEAH box helicase [Tannerella sp.]
MNTKEELILALSERPIFGYSFHVYSALRMEDGSLQLLGVPNVKQEIARGIPPEKIKLITLVEEVTDQALMKTYSRQKSVLAFLKEVKQDIVDRFIRPRIELSNCRIVETAQQTDIPVFWRQDISSKTLDEKHRIHIVPSPAECLFNLVKDEDGLRYFISLTCEGKEISLRKKPGVVLSEKPCIILTGNKIRYVENIEAKKMTPFFEKSHIVVPARSEELYLQNFVIKTMLTHEVRIQGIPVKEIKPEKKAFLSLERDFHQKLVLILSFQYENNPRIYPDSSKMKTVELGNEDGATVIRWYKRDMEWERHLVSLLQKEGLQAKGLNHFSTDQNDSCQLIEWLNLRKSGSLNEFIIENKLDRALFIHPVSIHHDFEMKIDWFEIHIKVVIGEYSLPFSCFRNHILAGNNVYTLPDGTVFMIPQEWFEKYYNLLLYCEESDDLLLLNKKYASLLDHALNKDVPEEKLEFICNILQVPVKRPLIPALQATLRTYQKEGFYWLMHLYENGFGGCLADDMGLGKTLQVITLLQHIYTKEPLHSLNATLVIVPMSLLHNWRNELARFAPNLRTFIYTKDRRLKSVDKQEIERAFFPYQVIITSYGLMRNDVEYLREYTFQMIVLDESQYIKNPASQAYQAARQLSSSHRLALTGTPLENSPEDLWAQFDFINEGLLGNLSSFKKNFIQPIVREKNKEQEELLKRLVSPFLLRRTKEEVAPDLPPLSQEIVFCNMTESQQTLYDKEKNRIRNIIMEAMENPELPRNNFIALQGLNRLRQLANHPRLVDPDYAEDSGKFDQIMLSFETLKANHHKVLIFSSYVKYLNLLAARFDEEGWKYAMLKGETLKREEEIRLFTENDDIYCFFISLKAGSTGLNLTAADYVFILDPWWNPAAEMQALSRAHRIGQKKNVMVYRFISTETIEEKIMRLQESKAALYETFVAKGNPLSQFTWAKMEELLN